MGEAFEDLSDGDVAILPGPDGEELFVDGSKKDFIKIRQIAALHGTEQGGSMLLPLQEESDGSQRLLNLLPALYKLKSEGGVFVVDELERSMHPMLARKFIEFFLKGARSGTAKPSLRPTNQRFSIWTSFGEMESGSQKRMNQAQRISIRSQSSRSAQILESTKATSKAGSEPFPSSAALIIS